MSAANDNDNFTFRENVILVNDCDLFAVCETFLSNNELLSLNGYMWVENNRKQRHSRESKAWFWRCRSFHKTVILGEISVRILCIR